MLKPKGLELKQNCPHENRQVGMGVLSRRVCCVQSRHKDFLTIFAFLILMFIFPL